jgi:mycothiol synthase
MTDVASVRAYRDEDFGALLALLDEVSAPVRTITRSGLRSFLSVPGYRPHTDLFVMPAADRPGIWGARDVRVTARGDEEVLILESWGAVHPQAPPVDTATALMQSAIARSTHLLRERDRLQGIVQARCGADDTSSRAVFEASGFVYARDLVSMRRRSLDGIEEPCFPPGVELRTYRVGADDDAWVHAFNEAFAGHWGGFMGMSPALWAFYLGEPTFKPEISLVAWNGPELVGFCHCRIDEEINALTGRRVGMIRYVGVVPRWRRKGLGAALTLAGVQALRDAGMETVALGVDAENVTGARRLYERFGFEVVERQVMYRTAISAADPVTTEARRIDTSGGIA